MVSITRPVSDRSDTWLLFLMPIVGAVYYLSLKSAFSESIQSVVTNAQDVNPFSATAAHWGSHWIYRAFSEVASTAFATFIAAGISRSHARAAGLIAGGTIAFGFAARVGIMVWGYFAFAPGEYHLKEPWYQNGIDALMIVVAPLIGNMVAEGAEELNSDFERGFAGINRAHFLWLWLVFYWYARGLISPVLHFYMTQSGDSILDNILGMLVFGIPAAALMFPLLFGLAYLSGSYGGTWRPYLRSLTGFGILLVGIVLGSLIQALWYFGATKLIGTH